MNEDEELPDAPAVGSTQPKDIKELAETMYACAIASAQPPEKLWTQADFLSLGIIPNGEVLTLAETLRLMMEKGRLKLLTKEQTSVWRLVKKEDAERSV